MAKAFNQFLSFLPLSLCLEGEETGLELKVKSVVRKTKTYSSSEKRLWGNESN